VPDGWLTLQNLRDLSVTGVLVAITIGWLKGYVRADREYKALEKRCAEEKERADRWEQVVLQSAIPVTRNAIETARDAIKVADATTKNSTPGGGPP
jgi:hypothetical protein